MGVESGSWCRASGRMGVAIPVGARERFLELVCGGLSLEAAGRAIGVSQASSVRLWRRFGHVELVPAFGIGGLDPVVPDPIPASGVTVRRRALSSEDRAT